MKLAELIQRFLDEGQVDVVLKLPSGGPRRVRVALLEDPSGGNLGGGAAVAPPAPEARPQPPPAAPAAGERRCGRLGLWHPKARHGAYGFIFLEGPDGSRYHADAGEFDEALRRELRRIEDLQTGDGGRIQCGVPVTFTPREDNDRPEAVGVALAAAGLEPVGLRQPARGTNGAHREDQGEMDDNFAPLAKGRW